MYQVALSVAACLRSGTRADVAWLVESGGIPVKDWSRTVVFTPGGGRLGSIDQGPIDGQLRDLAGRWATGRLVEIEIDDIHAQIAGSPQIGWARCLIAPADVMPFHIWELAVDRQPLCLVCDLEGDEVVDMKLFTTETVAEAGEAILEMWNSDTTGSALVEGRWVSVFRAVPQLVVVGESPVASALCDIATVLGWQTQAVNDTASATGVIATLSAIDKVVVTAHDLELAGAALLSALDSGAGYIGSLGSRRMQDNRADWLAYRGATDLSRVHGPAGLDIGAGTPGEIAVAILAEAIAERAG